MIFLNNLLSKLLLLAIIVAFTACKDNPPIEDLSACDNRSMVIQGRFEGQDSLATVNGIPFEIQYYIFRGFFKYATTFIKARGVSASDGTFSVCVSTADESQGGGEWRLVPDAPHQTTVACHSYGFLPDGDTVTLAPRIRSSVPLTVSINNPNEMPNLHSPQIAVSWHTLSDSTASCTYSVEAGTLRKKKEERQFTTYIPANATVQVSTVKSQKGQDAETQTFVLQTKTGEPLTLGVRW